MSEALDLLNSLSDEEIASLSGMGSNEAHIVVGRDRFIAVPLGLRRIAVQHDHDIETYTFDCPRYWDDNDLSKMAVYINYKLSNGYPDRYPVDNLRVDGDIIHFEWTISRNVTTVPGTVQISICAVNTDSEGNEVNHWNSEPNEDMYVSAGLECDENEIIDDPDLVSQLVQRMGVVEQINIKADEMEQILTDTQTAQAAAEEARDIATDASGFIKNEYANAIKSEVTGEIILVDDVSPIEHDVKCRIHGKNLVDYTKAVARISTQTVTIDTENESVLFSGNYYFKIPVSLPAGATVTFSCEGDHFEGYFVFEYDNGVLSPYTATPTRTTERPTKYIYIYQSPTGEAGENYEFKHIQLEYGDTATEYESYIDPTTVTLTSCGRNLIPYKSNLASETIRGITFTVNPDKSITCNGTATANATFNLTDNYRLPFGRYKMTGTPSGGNDSIRLQTNKIVGEEYITGSIDSGNTGLLNIDQDCVVYTYIVILSGQTVSNMTFKPMIVLESESDTTYEPSVWNTSTPAADGTGNVTSVTPSMTIYSDTPGVTITAEYNRDTNKVLSSISSTELSLTDTTTGKLYKIYVSNGKLMLVESEG